MHTCRSSFKPLLLILLCLPALTVAQVYSWKDADGKIHYGDRPPVSKQTDSRKLAAPPSETSDSAARRQSAAENKAVDGSKPPKESKKVSEDPVNAKIREDNCRQAKSRLAGLESGLIRFLIDSNGERIALDGALRETELAKARKTVDSWCAPS